MVSDRHSKKEKLSLKAVIEGFPNWISEMPSYRSRSSVGRLLRMQKSQQKIRHSSSHDKQQCAVHHNNNIIYVVRLNTGTGNRGLNALRESDTGGEYVAPLARVKATLSGESVSMAELLRPAEPLAVLCHGDFCRNNLLYRYDAATGLPVDVVVLDPAQARYASPAIDLSFFLYMNTSDSDRAANWDSYLSAYLDGVADVTPAGRHTTLTTADVDAEMRAHGLYGYAHCSFFLPAMVNAEPPDVERLTKCTADERIKLINESGGQEADRLLASIVRHMADRGYVWQPDDDHTKTRRRPDEDRTKTTVTTHTTATARVFIVCENRLGNEKDSLTLRSQLTNPVYTEKPFFLNLR